ncbi:MAG: hypothetical protein K2J60_06880 [Acetatifactor sp.]|nr:hypothetical protein [Acetatifactor sp.]
MSTFIKVMIVLDVNISLSGTGNTIQEKCVAAVQDIISGCAEGEAEYLARMVECMAIRSPDNPVQGMGFDCIGKLLWSDVSYDAAAGKSIPI